MPKLSENGAMLAIASLRRSRAATAVWEEQGEAVVEGASVATAVLGDQLEQRVQQVLQALLVQMD